MAEGGGLLDQDQLSCAICLDLLKDPVTTACGHSYCMGCIKGCWDQNDNTGVYSCPQCRQTFSPRPVLSKNTMLAEVVEKLKTGLQAAPPAHCYAGPGDVACDVCTGRKLKAVKSCLVCLASYCETHLQPHYESPVFKKHKLVKATGNLQEKICSHHDKILEVYCRTDQQCICYLCTMDEHRGHDTVSAAAERTEKQKQLGATQTKLQQRIQEREKELQDVRQAVQSLKCSAKAAVEDSERIFTELIRSIEKRCSEVKVMIKDQEKAAVSRAEGPLERLEKEIAELKRTNAQMEQISHTEDHIQFLQSCQSLCAPVGPEDFPSIAVSPHISFEAVRKSVSELKERLEEVWKEELVKISQAGTHPPPGDQDKAGTQQSNELRIVLLGKAGAGKSVANSILGAGEFKPEASSSSVTSQCRKARSEVDGRELIVIDTTTNPQELNIQECISLSSPGPHVFLVVIQLRGFAPVEQETMEVMRSFCAEAAKYTMVLFTHANSLKGKPIEEFLSFNEDLAEFIHTCRGRYHVFNSEENEVSRLLKNIDRMVEINGGRYYTNEMYMRSVNAIEEQKERILKEQEVVNRREEEELRRHLQGDALMKAIQQLHEKTDRNVRELERAYNAFLMNTKETREKPCTLL
ncbi:E3 ubiquitin/ISG15 ligase TRIM25-like [Anguilla rostrata]|uniref:E3 ubiquitin/ISG15 ligase TRIM25-like n=1 Tax=Anguilla rostrata TaxID=7938 RepID=UPI0030CC49D2